MFFSFFRKKCNACTSIKTIIIVVGSTLLLNALLIILTTAFKFNSEDSKFVNNRNNHNIVNEINRSMEDNNLNIDFVENYANIKSIQKPNGIINDANVVRLMGFSFIFINKIRNELNFCLNIAAGTGSVTGNMLNQYWTSRAIAFWLGYNWRLINVLPSNENVNKQCPKFSKLQDSLKHAIYRRINKTFLDGKHFMSFFPKSITFNHLKHNKISQKQLYNIQHFIYAAASHETSYCLDWTTECELFFTFYNPYFVKHIITDTHNAINTYYNSKNKNNLIQMQDSDIVIHLRCGDVISLGWPNPEYGFQTLSYYSFIINYAKKMGFIGNNM
eukprot:540123_1